MNKTKNINRIANRFAYKFGKLFLIMGAVFAVTGIGQASAQNIRIDTKPDASCVQSCDDSLVISNSHVRHDDGPRCNDGHGGIDWQYQSSFVHEYMHSCSYGWGGRDWYWKVNYYDSTCTWKDPNGTKYSYKIPPKVRQIDKEENLSANAIALCTSDSSALAIKKMCTDSCPNISKLIISEMVVNTVDDLLNAIPDDKLKAKIMTLLPSSKIAEMYDPNFVYQ